MQNITYLFYDEGLEDGHKRQRGFDLALEQFSWRVGASILTWKMNHKFKSYNANAL